MSKPYGSYLNVLSKPSRDKTEPDIAVYEVVVPVPKEAQQIIGKSRMKKRLKADTLAEAKLEAQPIIDQFLTNIREARGTEDVLVKIDIRLPSMILRDELRDRLSICLKDLGLSEADIDIAISSRRRA